MMHMNTHFVTEDDWRKTFFLVSTHSQNIVEPASRYTPDRDELRRIINSTTNSELMIDHHRGTGLHPCANALRDCIIPIRPPFPIGCLFPTGKNKSKRNHTSDDGKMATTARLFVMANNFRSFLPHVAGTNQFPHHTSWQHVVKSCKQVISLSRSLAPIEMERGLGCCFSHCTLRAKGMSGFCGFVVLIGLFFLAKLPQHNGCVNIDSIKSMFVIFGFFLPLPTHRATFPFKPPCYQSELSRLSKLDPVMKSQRI